MALKKEVVAAVVLLLAAFAYADTAYIRIYGLSNESTEAETLGNSAPVIVSYQPIVPIVPISEGNSRAFAVSAIDPDNDPLSYQWLLDAQPLGSEAATFTLLSTEGAASLTVIVSDGLLSASQSWSFSQASGEADLCADVACSQTEITCPDSSIAACTNACQPSSGLCTQCEPTCAVYGNTGITATSRYFVHGIPAPLSKRTMPCVNATLERQSTLAIDPANISGTIGLPEGFEVVLEPFSMDCHHGSVDFELSIPRDFADVQAMRCKGNGCFPTTIERVTALSCGGAIVEEFNRTESIVDPKFTPFPIRDVTEEKGRISSGKTTIQFDSDGVRMSMPESLEQPNNPLLTIIGTPLMLSFDSGAPPYLSVTLPYEASENIDENGILLFARKDGAYQYVDSQLSIKDGAIDALITEPAALAEDDALTLVLMASRCIGCRQSLFERVYAPDTALGSIILIHGIGSSPATFQELIDDIRLTQQPYSVWAYAYPSYKPLESNAKDLSLQFESHRTELGDNIIIVAHSFGGIVAQSALSLSRSEGHSYLPQVKKLIMAASPNGGSQGLAAHKQLLNYFVNVKSRGTLFSLFNEVQPELISGIDLPKIPGIDYVVLAGTRGYSFSVGGLSLSTAELFSLDEKNDGIITTASAQKVGDQRIDSLCKDYFEFGLSHTELIDEPAGREVIKRAIAGSDEELSALGNTRYFRVSIPSCSPDDKIVVIGRKIAEGEKEDLSGCSCGNAICGVGEDALSCPIDCAIPAKEEPPSSLLFLSIILPVFGLGIVMLSAKHLLRHHPRFTHAIHYIRKHYSFTFGEGHGKQEVVRHLKEVGFTPGISKLAIEHVERDFLREYLRPA